MRQILHVFQQAIAQNRKDGGNRPAIIVRTSGESKRCHEAELVLDDGTVLGKFVYSPHQPLACGARLWLQVDNPRLTIRPIGQ